MIADITAAKNLVALLLTRADVLGAKPFLWAKRGGQWQSQSWAEAAADVCKLAEGLHALGLKPGDRVMLVSENRPEWCLADFAIMAAGCITVPAYITNTERDHLHVLENSGAKAVIVANDKLAQPLLAAMVRGGRAEHLIAIEPLKIAQVGGFDYHSWASLLTSEPAAARAAVEARIAAIARIDPA